MSPAFRARLPALAVAGLLHVLFVWLFVNIRIIERAPPLQTAVRETFVPLLPQRAPPPEKRRRPAPSGGSTAITLPYFNPDVFLLAPPRSGDSNTITVALGACDPGRYDMASAEVRTVCDRIGLALKNDPGHFGVVSDVADPVHWRKELARREAPHLLPCMKAYAPKNAQGAIVMVDLQTLLCVYRIIFIEYDSRNHQHYSE